MELVFILSLFPLGIIFGGENVEMGGSDLKIRHDICHKHHKQRLCKIISTQVKFHFVNALLQPFMCASFWFLIMKTNDDVKVSHKYNVVILFQNL